MDFLSIKIKKKISYMNYGSNKWYDGYLHSICNGINVWCFGDYFLEDVCFNGIGTFVYSIKNKLQ